MLSFITAGDGDDVYCSKPGASWLLCEEAAGALNGHIAIHQMSASFPGVFPRFTNSCLAYIATGQRIHDPRGYNTYSYTYTGGACTNDHQYKPRGAGILSFYGVSADDDGASMARRFSQSLALSLGTLNATSDHLHCLRQETPAEIGARLNEEVHRLQQERQELKREKQKAVRERLFLGRERERAKKVGERASQAEQRAKEAREEAAQHKNSLQKKIDYIVWGGASFAALSCAAAILAVCYCLLCRCGFCKKNGQPVHSDAPLPGPALQNEVLGGRAKEEGQGEQRGQKEHQEQQALEELVGLETLPNLPSLPSLPLLPLLPSLSDLETQSVSQSQSYLQGQSEVLALAELPRLPPRSAVQPMAALPMLEGVVDSSSTCSVSNYYNSKASLI